MLALNHASAGCITRMTGCEDCRGPRERTMMTLERLLDLLSAFEMVVWMTDGWPQPEGKAVRYQQALHATHRTA